MKKILLLIIIIILWGNANSQDTSIVKYFPLKVGNVWVYQNTSNGQWCNQISKRRVKVVSSININSHKYFLFSDTTRVISGGGPACYNYGSIVFDTLRIDSINGNIYKYSYQGCSYSFHELTQDSIKAHLHDTIKLNCGNDIAYTCFDTISHTIFGTVLRYISFNHDCFENYCFGRSFAKTIGEVSYAGGFMNGGNNATLLGCVIDGVLYGDTIFITGIEKESSEIPTEFKLYQNYPNPFNPTTKIKFSLPLPSQGRELIVTLNIYDILGREVASLIPPLWGGQEGLSPGTYEVEWDGSNYASGVYYYKLTATEYTETKKLILLK